jgi:hypothetical protein
MKVNAKNYDKALKRLCFNDINAALRLSRKVTANPGAEYVKDYGYIARGDAWMDNNGLRGRYYYGKRGDLIEFDLTDADQCQILGWI